MTSRYSASHQPNSEENYNAKRWFLFIPRILILAQPASSGLLILRICSGLLYYSTPKSISVPGAGVEVVASIIVGLHRHCLPGSGTGSGRSSVNINLTSSLSKHNSTWLPSVSLAASPRCSREMISGGLLAWSSSPLLGFLQISWSPWCLCSVPPGPGTPSPAGRSRGRRGQARGHHLHHHLHPLHLLGGRSERSERKVFSSHAGRDPPRPGAATHHLASVESGGWEIFIILSHFCSRDFPDQFLTILHFPAI